MSKSLAPLLLVALTIGLSLSLVACDRGQYDTPVDTTVRSQYDTTSRPMVDDGSTVGTTLEVKAPPVVVAETAADFVPPPNKTAPPLPTEASRFTGHDAVRFWIWNSKGSTHLFLAEGEKATIPSLSHVITVDAIGATNGGRVSFSLDGKQLPILRAREELRAGDTYIFVSELLLNDPTE